MLVHTKPVASLKRSMRATKVQVHCIVVKPIVISGCEAWWLTKVLESRLEDFWKCETEDMKIWGPVNDKPQRSWRRRHNIELPQLAVFFLFPMLWGRKDYGGPARLLGEKKAHGLGKYRAAWGTKTGRESQRILVCEETGGRWLRIELCSGSNGSARAAVMIYTTDGLRYSVVICDVVHLIFCLFPILNVEDTCSG